MLILNQKFFILILNIILILNTYPSIASKLIPCKQIKLVVPWGAGGGTDIIMRKIANKANKMGLKPQLRVVNVGGQGGNKGAKQVAKAKPDGCSLIALHESAITSYFTGRIDITWDAFETISMVTSTPSIIGANVNTPYNNLSELVAEAKKSPETITAGGTFGSTSQFVFLLLEDATGIKFKHVSYDGTKQRMTALLADNIKLGEINLAAALKFIKAGKLKALGVTNGSRLDQIPDIKTAQEQGVDVIYAVERGIFAPKGTPKIIIDYYSEIFRNVSLDNEFKVDMKRKGILIKFKNANNYKNYLIKKYSKMERVAIISGVYRRNDKKIKLAKIYNNFPVSNIINKFPKKSFISNNVSVFLTELEAEKEKRIELEKKIASLQTKKIQEKQKYEEDKQAPRINIDSNLIDSNVIITGRVTDNTQVAEILINGERTFFNNEGKFKTNFYVPRTGKFIEIIAFDLKGNKSSKILNIERDDIKSTSALKFDNLNPSKKKAKINPNALALIIGVADYKKTNANAIYADNDAKQFYDYAIMKLGVKETNIKELVNDKADKVEITLAVKDWISRSTKKNKSDIYIFFAGHGLATSNGEDMFLLPYDGLPKLLQDSAIKRKQLFADIQKSKPRSVTVFLDTCYSGATRGPKMLIASRPIVISAKEQILPDNFTVFTATAGDETSNPLEEAKHGMFSYFLMKGMEGDADKNIDNKITALELHDFVKKNVIQQSLGSQTPELQGMKDRILVNFN